MRRINIGVIGAGIYGTYHIRAFSCDSRVARVVFCELDEDRRVNASKRYGLAGYPSVREMIEAEQLDAVSIATSDPHHVTPAREAIEAGIRYLFIEKPLATTVAGAEEICAVAEQHGAQVFVDFHKRWDPAYRCMRDEMRAGHDTVVRGYLSLDDVIAVPRTWFAWSASSSPAWFLGVHCYDLIRYLTGSEPAKVRAQGSRKVLSAEGIDTWDSLSAQITMADDSVWTVDTSWILPETFPKSNDGQLVILTDHSYLKSESYRGVRMYTASKEAIPNYLFMNFTEDAATGFGLEPMHEFARDIVEAIDFRSSAFDGLQASRVAQAVHESAESGRIIEL